MADYSMWVVEYARVVEFPRGAVLFGDWNAGHLVLPYCYVVVKGEGHIAVVDTGFDNAEFGKVLGSMYGVVDWQPASTVLGRLGIDPADVDTIVLTHNHFDHAGGVEAFANAHVYIQEREITELPVGHGLPARLRWLRPRPTPTCCCGSSSRLKQNKLTLAAASRRDLRRAFTRCRRTTRTRSGSQYVRVENERDGTWCWPATTATSTRASTGRDGDGAFVPTASCSGADAVDADDGGDVAGGRRGGHADRAVPRAAPVGDVPVARVRGHPARRRAVAGGGEPSRVESGAAAAGAER